MTDSNSVLTPIECKWDDKLADSTRCEAAYW